MRGLLGFGTLALILTAAQPRAQQPPDFSGTLTVVEPTSSAGESITIAEDERGLMLDIPSVWKTVTTRGTTVTTEIPSPIHHIYTFDGRESGQPVPRHRDGTSVIVGRVVDSSTGDSVGDARVTISTGRGRFRVDAVFATDKGDFAFTNLARGQYTLSADAAGYQRGTFGQDFPDEIGEEVTVDGASRVERLRVPLWKSASISGRLTGDDGRALVARSVTAFEQIFSSGRTSFQPTAGAQTDDQGAYRISELPPGRYLLSVRATDTQPAIFFPNSLSVSGAQMLSLTSGAQQVADFTVSHHDVASPRGSIHGSLLGAPASASVVLLPDEGEDFYNTPLMRTSPDAKGSFQFLSVPAGNYIVRGTGKYDVRTSSSSSFVKNLAAEVRVSVADRAETAPPMNLQTVGVAGRVVFLGTSDRSSFQLVLLRADGRASEPVSAPVRCTLNSDGTFTVDGLASTKYRVSSSSGAWHVSDVIIDGRRSPNGIVDVGSGLPPVVVEATDAPRPTLSGVVVDGNGDPIAWAPVYVIPSDVELWTDFGYSLRFQNHRSDQNGHYSLQVPSGDYLVAATTSSIAGYFWMGRPIFDALMKIAVKVKVGDGELVTKELRAVKPPPW